MNSRRDVLAGSRPRHGGGGGGGSRSWSLQATDVSRGFRRVLTSSGWSSWSLMSRWLAGVDVTSASSLSGTVFVASLSMPLPSHFFLLRSRCLSRHQAVNHLIHFMTTRKIIWYCYITINFTTSRLPRTSWSTKKPQELAEVVCL